MLAAELIKNSHWYYASEMDLMRPLKDTESSARTSSKHGTPSIPDTLSCLTFCCQIDPSLTEIFIQYTIENSYKIYITRKYL